MRTRPGSGLPRAGLLAIALSLAAASARADDVVVQSPEALLATMESRLADLPPEWITSRPLQLDVSFNLRFPPKSAEAEAFLANWYRTIHALPGPIRLDVLRMVAPTRYAYQVSLRFANWRALRIYETSRGLLDYYHADWKPYVTDAEERLSVVDPLAAD